MEKKLYKEQKHSLYEMAKNIGLNVNAFYGYLDGSKKIDNMLLGNFIKLSQYEQIEPFKLYLKIKEEQRKVK